MAGDSFWVVKISEMADRDIGRLPEEVAEEAADAIRDLAYDPFPEGCIAMRRYNDRYRIRVGGAYRVVYRVHLRKRRITVFYVRHRSEVYRGMKNPALQRAAAAC
jgi:mRNA interferase RelE/StbE